MLGGYYLGQIYLGGPGGGILSTLSVQYLTHGHIIEPVVIIQKHTLAINAMSHQQTLELTPIFQGYTLKNVADLMHAQGAAPVNNTGGGGAHNNLQPYIVVRMWKRTA